MKQLPRWKKHSSGLETILVEKHDSPILKLDIVFPFGSYEDPALKDGILNFVGDMLLRGTTDKSRDEIEFALDHLGASLNAYTGYHSVVVEGRVLKKNLKAFLSLTKEILTKPRFDPSEIQKLKNEIKSDLLLRLEDDQDLAKYHFFKEVYARHPYSRDVVGTAKTIDGFNGSELPDVYSTYLNRNGMLIGASGDLTESEFESAAHEIYEFFPSSPKQPTKIPFKAAFEGREIVLIDKPDLTQTQFFIGHPGLTSTDEDLIPLDVFVTAFAGSGFQAKYMQEIRVKRGWSYGAYGNIDARRDGGSFYLYTFPKNQDTVDAIALSLDLFEQAANGSLLDSKSIDFAKNYLIRSYPFKIDTPDKILSQKIYNKLVGRSEDYLERFRERVESVNFEKATSAAQKHLHPRDSKIVMVCTASNFEESLSKRISPKRMTIKKYTDID